MIFWNVAGLKKKDREFWEYIEGFDIIGLCETWVEEKEWERMKRNMSKKFEWKCQYAIREKCKGRAKGGIITGIRKEIEEIDIKEAVFVNGMQERRLRVEGEIWRIITVYNGEKMRTLRRELEEMIEEREEEILCIGGDFNARIGGEGKNYEGDNDEERQRSSKDGVINTEGKEFLGMLEERGWEVGNGNMRGDEEGEWTYSGGRGTSVVDYMVVNREAWDRVIKLTIGERVESDHQPLEVEIRGGVERLEEEMQKKTKEVIQWDEESIKKYKEKAEEVEVEGEEVEDVWENLKKAVEKSMVRKRITIRRRKIGEKDWWDEECKRKKRGLKRTYKRWRMGKEGKEVYVKLRREFREMCRRKEEKRLENYEEEVRSAKTEEQIWKIINKERKKRVPIEEDIKMEEWENHFMQLLEGSKEDRREEVERRSKEEDGELEIQDQEIEEQINNLKRRKAAGVDGIAGEAWKFSDGRIKGKLKEILKKV
ncbi:trichohyalin-like [Temnothorax curvispinosus]|uniref:Trichohyalin-like n=1 Tax=Temnothorax curvispinosus TaxID=300111 RepID=A0A6J1QUI7_9HYME|nr:trichohyalin-like [Temnothorax curvispinosus]